MSVSDELRYLYETDQRDRLTSHILFNSTRDQTRLQRVLTLDQKGLITAPEAQYHAALILQHGSCPDHFRRAYELSHRAAQAQVPDAQWLSRAPTIAGCYRLVSRRNTTRNGLSGNK
jgi:hypothetical protein